MKPNRMKWTALAGALVLAVPVAAAQDVKVGYINLLRIEKESTAAARAMEALKQEFEPRNQQASEMQKRIAAARRISGR